MSSRLRQLAADPAVGYVLRAVGWFLFFLGALRLPWLQNTILIPFARLQGQAAAWLRGEELRVLISTSCTGSDAIAVCMGAILAFPVPWRQRLLAAAGGFGVITAVNTVRIGHLSGLTDQPELLDLFHLRIWPAVIILVAAAYAFWWMHRAAGGGSTAGSRRPGLALARLPAVPFLGLTVALVGLYYLAYERLLANPLLGSVAHGTATATAALMGLFGSSAQVAGGVLQTGGHAWLVTPECVTTPLIPIFVAAVLTLRARWWVRLALLAATPLLFFVLGIGRLMVLALPPMLVGSRSLAVHAFYQMLLAIVLVVWLAARGDVRGRWAAAALAVGTVVGLVIGSVDIGLLRPLSAGLGGSPHLGHGWTDEQGALLLLPGFGSGLITALWMVGGRPAGWRGLALAGGLVAGGAAALVISIGELSSHTSLALPVVAIRALSLALPVLAAWALGWIGPRRTAAGTPLREAPSPAA